MPVPGNGKQWVGIRTNSIEQQGHGYHTQNSTSHDAPGRDTHNHQHNTAQQDSYSGSFTDGALNGAEEGIKPGNTVSHHFIDTALSGETQCGCTGEAVNSCPYRITGDLAWVCKEQERTASQSRVQEVLASTTKHFLTDHNAKTDTQSNLPTEEWKVEQSGRTEWRLQRSLRSLHGGG